jgi:hypothetical protein
MLLARSVPHKNLFLMLFHIKTLRFSNKFHQIKVFNIKITKNGLCFGYGTVRAFTKNYRLNGKTEKFKSR